MTAGAAPAPVVDQEVVRAIVDQVWESLLEAVATPWTGPDPAAAAVVAEVALVGAWSGRVRLGCDRGAADALARVMLDLAADDEVGADDVEDAVGEVVNVVGGNVKGTLPGTTALGLPQVRLDGPAGHAAAGRTGGPATRYVVDWAGAPVVVEVDLDPVT